LSHCFAAAIYDKDYACLNMAEGRWLSFIANGNEILQNIMLC